MLLMWDVLSSCLLFCTYTDLKPVLSFMLSGKTYTWMTNNIDRRKLIQMLSYVFYLFLVFSSFSSMTYYILCTITYIISYPVPISCLLSCSGYTPMLYHIFSYTIFYCHILCICVFTLTIELAFTIDSRGNLVLFVIQ